MKLLSLSLAALLVAFSSFALAADGLIVVKSPRSVAVTMDRFEALAKQRGLTVFARIDHAAGAASVGKTLRPTEVIIFGNPRWDAFHGMLTDRGHRPAIEGACLGRRICPGMAWLQ